MAPPIKYFIIVFIVFYLYSYNGCSATQKMCEDEITTLFRRCTSCSDQNASIRVVSYLKHIYYNIVVCTILTHRYGYQFVKDVIGMLYITSNYKPHSPEHFCTVNYSRTHKTQCEQGMKLIFNEYYSDWNKSVVRIFTTLSTSIIKRCYKKYKDYANAYLTHVEGYIAADTRKFHIGTTPQKYCENGLRLGFPAATSSNQPLGLSLQEWETNLAGGNAANPASAGISRAWAPGLHLPAGWSTAPTPTTGFLGVAPHTAEGYDDWCPP